MTSPVLITLSSPTCSGKTHLLNYIRHETNFPCLVSTTTRAPRINEQDGIDYYFISDEESLAIEKSDGFAELAIYNNYRYGVTKEEFNCKLLLGPAFLIVEPYGIDHYVQPALEQGARHIKLFVHAPLEVRLERFKNRVVNDLDSTHFTSQAKTGVISHINRLISMLTIEQEWENALKWDAILDGTKSPEYNIQVIKSLISKL